MGHGGAVKGANMTTEAKQYPVRADEATVKALKAIGFTWQPRKGRFLKQSSFFSITVEPHHDLAPVVDGKLLFILGRGAVVTVRDSGGHPVLTMVHAVLSQWVQSVEWGAKL